MTTFTDNEQTARDFYDKSQELIVKHNDIYTEYIHKLNEPISKLGMLSNNLDDLMSKSCPKFDEFRQMVNDRPLKNDEISFVYDVNKEEYVTGCPLPDKHIIKKTKYHLKHCSIRNTKGGDGIRSLKNISDNILREQIVNLEDNCGWVQGPCYNDGYRGKQLRQANLTCNLNILMDDYFNIYLPEFKLYLIVNYIKYPLYSFFNIDIVTDMPSYLESNETRFYNNFCKEDTNELQSLKSFDISLHSPFNSMDYRTNCKPMFKELLKFYNYDKKQSYYNHYKIMAENISLITSPIKSELIMKEPIEIEPESSVILEDKSHEPIITDKVEDNSLIGEIVGCMIALILTLFIINYLYGYTQSKINGYYLD
jgi:hypothetical protein